MSALDELTATPFKTATPPNSLQSLTATPHAPAPSQTPSSLASLTAKPFSSAPAPQTPAAPSPYFQGKTPTGAFLGISDEIDPFSGKPYFAYRTPGATSTTTDKTRVAPETNPEEAKPTLKSQFENPRMPESASHTARIEGGATPDEQLDHRMALAVGGSNAPENLKLVPTSENQAASKLEGQLPSEIASGKISLFDAQRQEAQNKGLPVPFTDQELKSQPNFWQKFLQGGEAAGHAVLQAAAAIPDGLEKVKEYFTGPAASPMANWTQNINKNFNYDQAQQDQITKERGATPLAPDVAAQQKKLTDSGEAADLSQPATIKYPFSADKGFELPNNLGGNTVKGIVEFPETFAKTMQEGFNAAFGKTTTPDGGAYPIQSDPQTVFNNLNDQVVAQGGSQNYANWTATIGAMSAGILDMTPLDSILNGSVKAIAAGAVPTTEEQIAAHALLGSPTTMEEAATAQRNALRLIGQGPGSNQEAASTVNAAYQTLQRTGIPDQSLMQKGARFAQSLVQPIKFSDIPDILKGKAPDGFQWAGPNRMLPGYRSLTPNAPKMGLSMEPMERVGGAPEEGAPDYKAPANESKAIVPNDSLAEEAKKYSSAEEFVKSQTPLYHGTNSNFEKFDISKSGSNTGSPDTKGTIFLSSSKDVAQSYGSRYSKLTKSLDEGFTEISNEVRNLIGKEHAADPYWSSVDVFHEVSPGYTSYDPVASEAKYGKNTFRKLQILSDKYDRLIRREFTSVNGGWGAAEDGFPEDTDRYNALAKNSEIKEVYANVSNPLVVDIQGGGFDSKEYSNSLDLARKEGRDGVIFKNVIDTDASPLSNLHKTSDVYAVFDPKNIKTKSELTDLYNKTKETTPTSHEPTAEQKTIAEVVQQHGINDRSGSVPEFNSKGNLTPEARAQRVIRLKQYSDLNKAKHVGDLYKGYTEYRANVLNTGSESKAARPKLNAKGNPVGRADLPTAIEGLRSAYDGEITSGPFRGFSPEARDWFQNFVYRNRNVGIESRVMLQKFKEKIGEEAYQKILSEGLQWLHDYDGVPLKIDGKLQYDSAGNQKFKVPPRRDGAFGAMADVYRELYTDEVSAGVPVREKQNYAPVRGVVKLKEGEVPQEAPKEGRRIGLRPGFTIARHFDTHAELMAHGGTPLFENGVENLANRLNEHFKAMARAQFWNEGVSSGYILPSEFVHANKDLIHHQYPGGHFTSYDPDRTPSRTTGYMERGSAIEKVNTHGWMGPKPLVDLTNNYLKEPTSKFERFLRAVARGAAATRNMVLGVGIPKTALNVHYFNVLPRDIAADVFGGKGVAGELGKTVGWTLRPSLAAHFIETNLPNAIPLYRAGMLFSSEDMSARELGEEPSLLTRLSGKFEVASKAWHHWFGGNLFGSFLPARMMQNGMRLASKYIEQGIAPDEAYKRAATEINDFYGNVDSTAMGRDKNLQNLIRTIALAPNYTINNVATMLPKMLRGVAEDFKIVKPINPGTKEYAIYAKYMYALLGIYAAANIVNKEKSGHYMFQNDPLHQFDIAWGTDDQGKTRYIGLVGTGADMIRLPLEIASAIAQGKAQDIPMSLRNRLSTFTAPLISLVTNSDWAGNPILGPDKYGSPQSPMTQVENVFNNTIGSQLPGQYQTATGYLGGKQSLEQTGTGLLGLPLKYKNENTTTADINALAAATPKAQAVQDIKPIYAKLHAQAVTDPKGAQAVYDKLTPEQKIAYQTYKGQQKSSDTKKAEDAIYPTYQKLSEQKKTDPAGAQTAYNALTQTQQHAYQLLKKRLGGQ